MMKVDAWFSVFVFFNVGLLTLLALNVSRVRIREHQAHGDGGKAHLSRAIRAHGNGVEHAIPFALILLALESCPAHTISLMTLSIGFSIARVMHATAMLGSFFQLRRIAALLTYLFEALGVIAIPVYSHWF